MLKLCQLLFIFHRIWEKNKMKLAVLIQCHKSSKQVNELLKACAHSDIDFFIHVDSKSNISDELLKTENVFLLPNTLRVDVQWGEFSQVIAALNLLKYANKHAEYDYYWQISGQDFPIVPAQRIVDYLDSNLGANYMDLCPSLYNGAERPTHFDKRVSIYYPRFMLKRNFFAKIFKKAYQLCTGGQSNTFGIFKRKMPNQWHPHFGSCWWCLHKDFVNYLLIQFDKNPKDFLFFKNSICSDESLIPTIFMNSPYASSLKEYLHYIDWSQHAASPKNLDASDFQAIIHSGKFMARKINEDYELISLLKAHIQEMV